MEKYKKHISNALFNALKVSFCALHKTQTLITIVYPIHFLHVLILKSERMN